MSREYVKVSEALVLNVDAPYAELAVAQRLLPDFRTRVISFSARTDLESGDLEY